MPGLSQSRSSNQSQRILGSGLSKALAVLVLAGAVSACSGSRDETRILFDGNYYKAKTSAVTKDDRKIFETVVRRPDQGIKGALAAGEHDAKGYCLKSFGTSDIAWTRGPNDPGAALYAETGSLVLNGSCVLW